MTDLSAGKLCRVNGIWEREEAMPGSCLLGLRAGLFQANNGLQGAPEWDIKLGEKFIQTIIFFHWG